MSSDIKNLEKRVRRLTDYHERLRAIIVTDATEEGYYALTIRDWEHPNEHVEGRILAERFAYLTKGGGNDGWYNGEGGGGAVAINRRDTLEEGRLAQELAQAYAAVAARQRSDEAEADPYIEDLRGE